MTKVPPAPLRDSLSLGGRPAAEGRSVQTDGPLAAVTLVRSSVCPLSRSCRKFVMAARYGRLIVAAAYLASLLSRSRARAATA